MIVVPFGQELELGRDQERPRVKLTSRDELLAATGTTA
jgi:hypothetical protein